MEPYLTVTSRLQPSLMLFVHLCITRTKSWSVGTQSKISRNTDHSRRSRFDIDLRRKSNYTITVDERTDDYWQQGGGDQLEYTAFYISVGERFNTGVAHKTVSVVLPFVPFLTFKPPKRLFSPFPPIPPSRSDQRVPLPATDNTKLCFGRDTPADEYSS